MATTTDSAEPPEPLKMMNDLGAEKALLGMMMLSPDATGEVLAETALQAIDFWRPAHETIFLAILQLYAREEPADPITLIAELTLPDQRRTGGLGYLKILLEHADVNTKAATLAERVHAQALRRRMWIAAQHIAQCAEQATAETARDAIDMVQAEALALTAVDERQSQALNLGDVMEDTLDELEAIGSDHAHSAGIPTGFCDIDALTNGLRPGQLVVIGSRPAMGSSTLALDMLRSCAITHNLPAVLFTLETGRNEVAMRLLSAEARVPLHHMRSGTLSDDDWTRLARRMPQVSAAPLLIQDSDSNTFTDIRSQCRRLKQHRGLHMVVIDNLQLLTYGTRPFDSRYEEVSEISRCLKLLAKELNLPVIAVSKLNRGPEARPDKRPAIFDLRDSGTLEDNADLVILLHREDAYDRESPRTGEADLIVAKHRGGPWPLAACVVAFQGQYSRFVDLIHVPRSTELLDGDNTEISAAADTGSKTEGER